MVTLHLLRSTSQQRDVARHHLALLVFGDDTDTALSSVLPNTARPRECRVAPLADRLVLEGMWLAVLRALD